jgi:diguanylate cyclase (GGDEF)-like protein
LLSNELEQTLMPQQSALVVIIGVFATNLLFFLVARSSVFHQPPQDTLAVAQCIFGITWITLYAFLSRGTGELVPGMYLTAILFAMFRVQRETFTHVLVFTGISYIAVTAAKAMLLPATALTAAQILSITAFIGICAALLVFAQHIHTLRAQLIDRNSSLQSMLGQLTRSAEQDHPGKSFNRHFIMEALAREKGRADRFNQLFAVCMIEVDDIETLVVNEGRIAATSIAEDIAKRLRNEVRSMDGINPAPGKSVLGRMSGEVYVLILPSTGIDGAHSCAERVRAGIAEKPFLESCRVTVSAGIVEYRRNEPLPSLLTRVEAELKTAQRAGGNRVCGMEYREPMDADVMELPALHP